MSPTAITNVRVFDGENTYQDTTVVIDGKTIISLGGEIPEGATVIDGKGCTLLPGFIDSHVHTAVPFLELALKFGVTTELEMAGDWSKEQRKEVAERDDVADLRTASHGLTPLGGHPAQLTKNVELPPPHPLHSHGGTDEPPMVNASSPEEAVEFVRQRVQQDADYIKIMIEEGTVFKEPGLPGLTKQTVEAAVQEAHKHNKLAIAHALTYDAAEMAIGAGVDGLAHLFIDRGADDSMAEKLAGKFMTPCLTVNAAILGRKPVDFASDPRVSAKVPQPWLDHFNDCMGTFPEGDFDVILKSVGHLHKAGIDLLVGTDSSFPAPKLGGVVHGASVHHELQLFVQAGFTPTEALRAVTSLPARIFGLSDRGRIQEGLRADLLLVVGDPTSDIKNTLSIKSVWRRGALLTSTS